VLFSHPEIVAFLGEQFECAWQGLRPVPFVEIDFGNGYRLERTLNGNIATWFCTPDGRAYDVLPGLVGPAEYLARLRGARRLHEALASIANADGSGVDLHQLVRRYHESELALQDHEPATLRAAAERERQVADLVKSLVESSIKRSVGKLHAAAAEDFEAFATTPDDEELAEDTAYNREHRYPAAHRLLESRPLATPAELTWELFREVLHVDLEDPYLGLAPRVLGGELGRHGGL